MCDVLGCHTRVLAPSRHCNVLQIRCARLLGSCCSRTRAASYSALLWHLVQVINGLKEEKKALRERGANITVAGACIAFTFATPAGDVVGLLFLQSTTSSNRVSHRPGHFLTCRWLIAMICVRTAQSKSIRTNCQHCLTSYTFTAGGATAFRYNCSTGFVDKLAKIQQAVQKRTRNRSPAAPPLCFVTLASACFGPSLPAMVPDH